MFRYKLICAVVSLVGCMSCGFGDVAEERAYKAARAEGDIVVGAVWSWSAEEEMIGQGLEMAVAEVNADGVLGRKLRLITRDDKASVMEGLAVAREFADNPDVVAVIGHFKSHISIPASATYEYSGLLMLSPGATSSRLTEQGFHLVFRNIPTDKAIGKQLADFAGRQAYRRMLIYYAKDAYGRGFANSFERRASDLGIQIVDRLSFDPNSDSDFQTVLKNWQYLEYDAICLVARMPHGGTFVRQARELGTTAPILCSDGLDGDAFLEAVGKETDGVFVASLFDLADPRPEVKLFAKAFRARYDALPPARTVPGYDAVKLLAHAMQKAGSAEPEKVAKALHATRNWPGVTGPHTFDEKGDVVDKPVVIKVVRNGKFEYLKEQQ